VEAKGGVSGGRKHVPGRESGPPRGCHLRPRVPGRGNSIQTLRPHQKGNGDAPTGAGHEDGGLPVGGEKGEEVGKKMTMKTLEVIAKVYVVAIISIVCILGILAVLQKMTDLEVLLIMSVAVGATSTVTLAVVALKGLIPLRR
jgi:hypothetical protein